MAATEVQIANLALSAVGISIFINSLDEASNEAGVCKLHYEPTRDMVLQDGYWNFAETRVTLADLGSPPKNWAYRYALPSDCLQPLMLTVEGTRNPRREQRIAYQTAAEGDSMVLYTDCAGAELVYTRRVTNPNLFSPLFVKALAYAIANEIALPLSAASALADAALQKYAMYKSMGEAASLRAQMEDAEPESEFITARL